MRIQIGPLDIFVKLLFISDYLYPRVKMVDIFDAEEVIKLYRKNIENIEENQNITTVAAGNSVNNGPLGSLKSGNSGQNDLSESFSKEHSNRESQSSTEESSDTQTSNHSKSDLPTVQKPLGCLSSSLATNQNNPMDPDFILFDQNDQEIHD